MNKLDTPPFRDIFITQLFPFFSKYTPYGYKMNFVNELNFFKKKFVGNLFDNLNNYIIFQKQLNTNKTMN